MNVELPGVFSLPPVAHSYAGLHQLEVKASGPAYRVDERYEQDEETGDTSRAAKAGGPNVIHVRTDYFDGIRTIEIDDVPSKKDFGAEVSVGTGAQVRSPLQFGRALYSLRLTQVLARAKGVSTARTPGEADLVTLSFNYRIGRIEKHVELNLDARRDYFPVAIKIVTKYGSNVKYETLIGKAFERIGGLWIVTQGERSLSIGGGSQSPKAFERETWQFTDLKVNQPMGSFKPTLREGATMVDRDRAAAFVGTGANIVHDWTYWMWRVLYDVFPILIVIAFARVWPRFGKKV